MSVTIVAAAVARRIHDPAHQDREQHERHEATDQRPVHGANHIGAMGATRAAKLARWAMGTPIRPAGGAPDGTRTAAVAAGAGRRGERDGTWHTGPTQRPRTVGSDERSSPRSWPSSMPPHHVPSATSSLVLTRMFACTTAGVSKRIRPDGESPFSGKRRNFTTAQNPSNCGVFVVRTGGRRNFRSFDGAPMPARPTSRPPL